MPKTYNYMFSVASKEDMLHANALCADGKVFSDNSRMPNALKWQMAREFLAEGDAEFTLFSPVSYEDIYEDDDATKCVAASYVADLRAQFLEDILDRRPTDMVAHALYVRNKQWQAKLRERANLNNLQNAFKSMRLT